MTTATQTCKHTEHRRDRATGRQIGLDPRLGEWQPCAATATLPAAP